MTIDPERTPVIIGGGQVNDRPDDPAAGLDSLGLMVAALRAAEADAGAGPLLSALDSIGIVDQISFRALGNLCGPLAAAIGAAPAINYQSDAPHGDTPVRLLNEAANRIGAGEVRLAAIVGGEALRTAAARARAAAAATGGAGGSPDALRAAATRREPNYAQAHGLITPVDVYPLYENAARAAWGQTLAEAQGESAAIWAGLSAVAAANPAAWLRREHSAAEILAGTPDNRPLAFPYRKLMVANAAVNQGAAVLVASLAEARRRGVAEDRMIHVGLGAAAKEPANILKRDRYDRSVSMELAIRRTLEWNGMGAQDFVAAELYSCFPCVPKMARRVLGWPVERPISVFGGLTFGGGPIANYMTHAIASMADVLRASRRADASGLLFANGGFATDNHAIILSRQPLAAARFPQDFDVQADADAARGPVPGLDKVYAGPATIESYTVFHGRDGRPSGGVVAARTPTGARTLAPVDAGDAALAAFLTDGAAEPVGSAGQIVRAGDGRRWWQRA